MSQPIQRSTAVMTKKGKIHLNKTMDDRLIKSYSELIRVEEDLEYILETNYEELINSTNLTDVQRQQQYHIFHFIETEKNYINRLRHVSQVLDIAIYGHSAIIAEIYVLIYDNFRENVRASHRKELYQQTSSSTSGMVDTRYCQVIRQLFLRLRSYNDLSQYEEKEIFGNITDVFLSNDNIWVNVIKKAVDKARETKEMMKPTDVFGGFIQMDVKFKSYIKFCLQQDSLCERIRDFSNNPKEHTEFRTYLKFCESLPCWSDQKTQKSTDQKNQPKQKLAELMVEPMKRMTQYPIVLGKIREYTTEQTEQEFLDLVIKKITGFLTNINTQLRKRSENQKLQQFLLEMDDQDVWLAGDEEIISTCTEYLRLPINLKTRTEQRCLLKRGNMRIILENKKKLEVVAILFSDVLVLARQRKTNKKLTMVRQMYFLDKLILKKSEISRNGVILVYKNEIGLLSEALKLEICDNHGRDVWCNIVERAKTVFISVRSNNGTTLDIFEGEKYNPPDYDKLKNIENETLNNLRRTSSWLLTTESIEAIRKNRCKARNSSAESFRRALSETNLLEGTDDLPEISEGISDQDMDDESSSGELDSVKRNSKSKNSTHKKLSLDNLKPYISSSLSQQRFSSTDSSTFVFSDNNHDLSPTFSQSSFEERPTGSDNSESETMSLTERINDNEIAIQTEITFNNILSSKNNQQRRNSFSSTTIL